MLKFSAIAYIEPFDTRNEITTHQVITLQPVRAFVNFHIPNVSNWIQRIISYP